MRKKGIAVAGNMIVDMLYPIDGFPKPGELTTITALYRLPMKNRAAKRSFRFVARFSCLLGVWHGGRLAEADALRRNVPMKRSS